MGVCGMKGGWQGKVLSLTTQSPKSDFVPHSKPAIHFVGCNNSTLLGLQQKGPFVHFVYKPKIVDLGVYTVMSPF